MISGTVSNEFRLCQMNHIAVEKQVLYFEIWFGKFSQLKYERRMHKYLLIPPRLRGPRLIMLVLSMMNVVISVGGVCVQLLLSEHYSLNTISGGKPTPTINWHINHNQKMFSHKERLSNFTKQDECIFWVNFLR